MIIDLKNKKISKKNIVELCFGLLFVLPYAETGRLRNLLEYFNERIYIHPMVFIMLTITFLSYGYILRMKSNKNDDGLKSYFFSFFIIVFFIGAILSLYNNQVDVFLVQFLWYITPFLYARTIYKLIYKYKLNYGNILKKGLFLFTLFCVFSLVYSIIKFGFVAGTSTRLTGGSGGGGSVIFGYTIVLFFSLLIILRESLGSINILIYGVVLILTSIFTQSRGAIWMIFLMMIPYILGNKKLLTKLFVIFTFTIFIIFVDPIDIVYKYAPRAFKFGDSFRNETWTSALNIYINQPLLNILFGTGIGQFFPYQHWVINQRFFENFVNVFPYDGYVLLVQPHNTFIYLLIETGFVGLSLFLLGFIRILRNMYHKAPKMENSYLIVGVLIYLNLFDSVFLVLPGIAGVWWLVLFFMIGYVNQETRIKSIM